MSISNALVGLAACQVGIYYTLYKQKENYKKLIAGLGIILIGYTYILIQDDQIMYVIMLLSLLIGFKFIGEYFEK